MSDDTTKFVVTKDDASDKRSLPFGVAAWRPPASVPVDLPSPVTEPTNKPKNADHGKDVADPQKGD